MATLQQIRNKVDAFLADLWVNKIVPKEEAYFALHGHYAQVLKSPEVMPEDDSEDFYIKRPPPDELYPDDFEFEIATPIPAQFEIHTYDKRPDHGFVGHVYVKVNGKVYHRAKAHGVGGQDIPWHEVTLFE